jgi:glutaminase
MSSAVDGPAGDAFVSTGELPERGPVALHSRRAVALRRAGALARPHGVRLGVGHELAQPEHWAAAVCHYTLAVMLTAGLYETSGEWRYDVGLPAKSGIGGGIVTVSPGKGGMGTFAPPLDQESNSVKGQLVAKFLSARLGLDLLISQPARR